MANMLLGPQYDTGTIVSKIISFEKTSGRLYWRIGEKYPNDAEDTFKPIAFVNKDVPQPFEMFLNCMYTPANLAMKAYVAVAH